MLRTTLLRTRAMTSACLSTVLMLAAGGAAADDRELLRDSSGQPYLFVIFDTSTSMANSPPCTRDMLTSEADVDPFDAMCSTECDLGAARCQQLCPDFGCIEYDLTSFTPPSGGDIIDRDEDTAVLDGLWPASGAGDAYVGDYRSDNDPSVLKSVTYDPNITVPGEYQVYLWWPTDPVDSDADGVGESFASNTLVDVIHDGGVSTLAVDQRIEPGQWNLIGVYDITVTGGDAGKVILRNESSNGIVIADGVRWARITRPTCIDTGYRCQQEFCPLGDCYQSLRADDPRSKFYQAKDALAEVIDGSPNVHFGFGTYQQDQMRLRSKHWLYRVRDTDPMGNPYALPQLAGEDFLQVGDEEVFGNYSTLTNPNPNRFGGDGWDCKTRSTAGDHQVGCDSGSPADLTDPWEVERTHRIPKLGREGTYDTEAWYRVDHDGNQIYKVLYSRNGSASFGDDPFAVDVEVSSCPGGTCVTGPVDGNNICEAGDTENCTNTSDCNGKQNGPASGKYCCGDGGGTNPVPCSDPRCTASGKSCTTTPAGPTTSTIYYDLVSDYVAQDESLTRQPIRNGGYFSGQSNVSVNAATQCNGMDVNDDTADDIYRGYNLRWATVPDARGDDYNFDSMPDVPREDFYDEGDRVPLDWLDRNQTTLLERLAPNIIPVAAAPTGQPETPPDFRVSVYFQDDVLPGDDPTSRFNRKLRLDDEAERPVLAIGNTPIAASLASFREWYLDDPTTDDAWADFAAGEDPLFGCRSKFVLLLTDGLEGCTSNFCASGTPAPCTVDAECTSPETCISGFCSNGAPTTCTTDASCTAPETCFTVPCPGETTATALQNAGVKTHVVGFGVPDDGSLSCLASAGGTSLLLANNRDELITQLNTLFQNIQVDSRAFASASIPAIQSSSADKIFLSSFVPLPAQSFWPGRINAFRKPLPLTVDNEPDLDKQCADVTNATDDRQSACHIWEAGKKLCDQAPEAVDADLGIFQLGADPAAERRVVYGKESSGAVPNALQLFDLPPIPMAAGDPLDPITEDLMNAFDPSLVTDWNASMLTPNDLEDYLLNILGGTLGIKTVDPMFEDQVDACDLSGGGEGYILGDVFHASPVSISNPGNFTYFANNLHDYRDFARKHAWRRKMLAAAANDGQLHFFDAGIRQVVDNDFTSAAGDFIELYNDGSGHELFSYIPRFALPVLREQVDSTRHIFSLDSTVATGDVFIDPTDDGTDDTQWRSVVIGGVREAGDVLDTVADVSDFKAGYYALDITQPDVVNLRQQPSTDPTSIPCPASNTACDDTTTSFPTEYTPSCLDFFTAADSSQTTPTDCDFPFPLELWTFDDSVEVPGQTGPFYLDEDDDGMGNPDGNGIPDLADTWSKAVIGQIEVCTIQGGNCVRGDPTADGDLVIKQVAIFGGGMDAENKGAADVGGNWLYIVDVETGDLIYKRELEGSAAADPAVLDVNRDGVFDRVYIGTTNGLLYKVDLSAVDPVNGGVPGFDDPPYTVDESQLITAGGTPPTPITPAIELNRISDPLWDPFVILDTGGPYESPARRGSPLYHAPAAFYIPELDAYGLAIGTGDREDLWNEDNGEDVAPGADPLGGRFFVIVDNNFENDPSNYDPAVPCDVRLPVTEACLKTFAFNLDPTVEELATNYLLDPDADTTLLTTIPDPQRGWVLTLTPGSRITAEAFIVAGVTIFSAFDPTITTTALATCALTGTTRSFVVSATNSSPIAPLGGDDDSDPENPPPPGYGERAIDRYHQLSEFATAPFVDSTATRNPSPDSTDKTLLDLIDDEISEAVRDSLIRQFPRGSRFNKAFSLVIAALRSTTGLSVYTTIPIAAYPADWKDQ